MAPKAKPKENKSTQNSRAEQEDNSFEAMKAIEAALQAEPAEFTLNSAVKIFFRTLIFLFAVALVVIAIAIWLYRTGEAPAWLADLLIR